MDTPTARRCPETGQPFALCDKLKLGVVQLLDNLSSFRTVRQLKRSAAEPLNRQLLTI